MKTKLFFTISFMCVCAGGDLFAAQGLVIKLDVTDRAQSLINTEIRKKSGLQKKQARHHVTIAYIDRHLPDKQMEALGKKIVRQLEADFRVAHQPIDFEVRCAAQPFEHVIALIPSSATQGKLRAVNVVASRLALQLHYPLNTLTQPSNYTPHMTLSVNGNDARYLPGLNQVIRKLKSKRPDHKLFFKLAKFSYTVMK